MIKGVTVILYEKTQTGVDGFNRPVYTETPAEVDNVLVTPASSDDIINELSLTGKKLVYELSIPKDDEHVWEDRRVTIWGEDYHVFDFSRQWIEANVPLSWNAKAKVERYG